MEKTYHETSRIKYISRLREQLDQLPSFLGEFFRGIGDRSEPRTQVAYSYDLVIFFEFLIEYRPSFKDKQIKELTVGDLELVRAEDIELFMEYLSYYERPEDDRPVTWSNQEYGKSRKLAAVRTLLSYFYKKQKISSNPAELVDFPKMHEKEIVRLEVDEVARLLDEVESGELLSMHQQKFHAQTRLRDVAIVTLMLGTGMRVSECVGIDIQHIDLEVNGVKVTRKGGDEAIIYFGREVRAALEEYLAERVSAEPLPGHTNALFLSMQNKRITDRAVQNLVKKYSKLVTTLKNISPHKLRSTYGTNLYRETGDIYLVADVLGHSDINTTRKHYAHMDEDRRRQAARVVKLRSED
ncbi:MAG: tyrosine-type recombinase/integrase [Clostridiales bacterium]|jgi:site-specific recombinase XerD|nr:tyrosine-type recombinase/integrase [Clostridiales bacterium]